MNSQPREVPASPRPLRPLAEYRLDSRKKTALRSNILIKRINIGQFLDLLLLLLVAATIVTLLASPASAATQICGSTSGEMPCASPQGVATDFETGRIYVVDKGKNRVDVFAAEGEFLFAFGWGVDTGAAESETCTPVSGCRAGTAGAGAGQFSSPTQIAVDNVPGSSARHDVYVGSDSFRVQRFHPDGEFVEAYGWGVDTGAAEMQTCTTASSCQAGIQGGGECQLSGTADPIAVGPGGIVFVADSSGTEPSYSNRVEQLSAAGACEGAQPVAEDEKISALAVDSSEDFYLSFVGLGGVHRYGGTTCTLDPGKETTALTLDSAGHLYAAQKDGAFRVISEYSSNCESLSRFGYGEISAKVLGIAAYQSSLGDVIGSESGGPVSYFATPTPGPFIFGHGGIGSVGKTWASVEAEVNPEGEATEVRGEYVDDASYQADIESGGNGFGGAGVQTTPSQPLPPAAGAFDLNSVDLVIGCVQPSWQAADAGECMAPGRGYHYRLIATNQDGPSISDAGEVSTVQSSPQTSISATEIGTTGARLVAEVDPDGTPLKGRFEYVDDASFQQSGFAGASETAVLDFGAGEGTTNRSVAISSLQAGTTYHYRLAVDTPFSLEDIHTTAQTFDTVGEPSGGAGSAGSPSNEFVVRGVKKRADGSVVLSLKAFAPGTFVARAFIDKASRRRGSVRHRHIAYGSSGSATTEGGAIRLGISPRPDMPDLSAYRWLRMRVRISFQPSGGSAVKTKRKTLQLRPTV